MMLAFVWTMLTKEHGDPHSHYEAKEEDMNFWGHAESLTTSAAHGAYAVWPTFARITVCGCRKASLSFGWMKRDLMNCGGACAPKWMRKKMC